MSFEQFLIEQKELDEGLSTVHGKVEMAIREADLKYVVDKQNTKTCFIIDTGYTIESSNAGKVTLLKGKTEVDSFTEFDFNKIRDRVSKLIKDNNVKDKVVVPKEVKKSVLA